MAPLPPRLKLAFRILAELLVIAFFALIAWVGYAVLDVFAIDNLVSLPQVSAKYTQSVIPVSAVLFLFAELLTLPAVPADAIRGSGPRVALGEASHRWRCCCSSYACSRSSQPCGRALQRRDQLSADRDSAFRLRRGDHERLGDLAAAHRFASAVRGFIRGGLAMASIGGSIPAFALFLIDLFYR